MQVICSFTKCYSVQLINKVIIYCSAVFIFLLYFILLLLFKINVYYFFRLSFFINLLTHTQKKLSPFDEVLYYLNDLNENIYLPLKNQEARMCNINFISIHTDLT